jgi:hypothetical protein
MSQKETDTIAIKRRNLGIELQKRKQKQAVREATKVLRAQRLDNAIHITVNTTEVTENGFDGERVSATT